MDYSHHIPKSRKNKHLSPYKRGQIELPSNQGLSLYAIGKLLDRASNMIRNELKRGTTIQIKARKKATVYLPDAGQMAYERNRKNCRSTSKYIIYHAFIQYVEERI